MTGVKNKHIVLVGDSIFDNAVYVGKGESVSEQLRELVDDTKVTLLAVDGDVTTDVTQQLKPFPADATHVFLSCGGNDALQALPVLNQPVSTVREAFDVMVEVRKIFRKNTRTMLKSVLNKSSNLTVCTVYNTIPEITESALAALALFNEIILQEAIAQQLPIIDLRNICTEEADYSKISPIEPSVQGGEKIVRVIDYVVNNHVFSEDASRVYASHLPH